MIASDTRFKAAIAGAGIGNVLAGFGTDQYVREYTAELGLPWKHLDAWLRVSYPFLHADRIVTPTLFMAGDLDLQRAAPELGADVSSPPLTRRRERSS